MDPDRRRHAHRELQPPTRPAAPDLRPSVASRWPGRDKKERVTYRRWNRMGDKRTWGWEGVGLKR